MPTAIQAPRWFFDENSIGVAKALQYVRGDVTWPGGPGGLVPEGARDSQWLQVVGKAGWIVLTRDKRIRRRPLEPAGAARQRGAGLLPDDWWAAEPVRAAAAVASALVGDREPG